MIALRIVKVAPVFPIPKSNLRDKHTENENNLRKRSETSFKSLLEKELQCNTAKLSTGLFTGQHTKIW